MYAVYFYECVCVVLQTTVYWQNTNIEEICPYVSKRRDTSFEHNTFVFSHSRTAISFKIFKCFRYFVL